MSTEVALTADEEADLASFEETISNGLRTFVDVGEALSSIRDRKLYRQVALTFEDYARMQWGLSRSRAYALMSAAETVSDLSRMQDIPLPANERQASELRGLGPLKAAEVMVAAAEAGPVTAASIAEHREQIAPRPMPVAKVTETTKTEAFVNTDTGEVVEPVKPRATDAEVLEKAKALDPQGWDQVDFQARFAADILKAHRAVLSYSLDDVASLADTSQFDSLDELAKSITNFVAEARRKRGGLRLVRSNA